MGRCIKWTPSWRLNWRERERKKSHTRVKQGDGERKEEKRVMRKQITLWCSATHFSCRLLRAHCFPLFVILTTSHYLFLCNHHNQNIWILSVTTSVHGRSSQHHFSDKVLCSFSYFKTMKLM